MSERLDTLAAQIRADLKAAKRGSLGAVDRQLAIGRALLEAREILVQDREYGRWMREQSFGFSQQWGSVLRRSAEREDAVRAVVTTQVVTGAEPSIKRALTDLLKTEQEAPPEPGPLPDGIYRTIVADPPWPYGNTATRGAAEGHYPTMSLDAIKALDVAGRVAEEAHLYLWATNSFLREAFDVAAAWGFGYKTLLTWVKPQIGLGNYFRNRTEHVLFCTRGGLGTFAKNVSNVIEAPRGKHSSKPDCFYDMVETQSRGPYLELFARRNRFSWDTWGNECLPHVELAEAAS